MRNHGILVLMFVLFLQDIQSVGAETRRPFELFKAGESEAARRGFEAEFNAARSSGDKRRVWQAAMELAWFEDEISEHRKAIEHSNIALETASSLDDPFMIGRSLCWLGWAYSGLGLYPLAESFYQNAIEIGAPEGKIKHAHVWGLAQQELGAIRYKMGKVEEGRRLLLETYRYAQEHEVLAGVAEGGAHLAEIALQEGEYSQAEQFAKSAVTAARGCDCSQYNLSRARVVLLKTGLERARFDVPRGEELVKEVKSLMVDCERIKQPRCLAETKLLMSKLTAGDDFEKRYSLVQEAFEALSIAESELRGVAEAELGKMLLERQDSVLAEFYLKNGLQVSKDLFRKVDDAYITGELAHIDALKKNERARLEKLQQVVRDAKAARAWALALENEAQLAKALDDLGYTSLAIAALQGAGESAKQLIDANPVGSRERVHFQKLRTEYAEQQLELGLSISQEDAAPPIEE